MLDKTMEDLKTRAATLTADLKTAQDHLAGHKVRFHASPLPSSPLLTGVRRRPRPDPA